MTEQLSLRERKKIETRNRILYTAVQLFQERGFDQTSVDEIAAQANVSRGTFFNYFPNKEHVLHEIATNELQDLKRLVQVDLAEQPSAVFKIRRMIHQLVVDTLPYFQVARYVLLGAMLTPADENAFSLRLSNILIALVREAQAQDEIRADLAPEEVMHAISGAYLSVLLEQIARDTAVHVHNTAAAQEIIERTVDMLFAGIAGPAYRAR